MKNKLTPTLCVLATSACLSVFSAISWGQAQAPRPPISELTIGAVHEYGCDSTSEQPKLGLRALFHQVGGEWAAVCPSKRMGYTGPDDCAASSLRGNVDWNTFKLDYDSGQAVSSIGWLDLGGSLSAGLLELRANDKLKLKDGLSSFGGWCSAEKTWKPLVVWRGRSAIERQTWSSSTPSKSDLSRVWPALRKLVPKIPSCQFTDDGKPKGRARPTRVQDIEIHEKRTRKDGAALYRASVSALLREECAEYGGFASDLWFFGANATTPLRSIVVQKLDDVWGYTLELVEFADFDGNGRLGALFWFSGYNEDGFVLLTDNFRKQTKFTWGYH